MAEREQEALISAAELLKIKREHLRRLANQKGADGENFVLSNNTNLIPRPTGRALEAILSMLAEAGVIIKKTSFDAIALPEGEIIDFFNLSTLRETVEKMTFVEIKTANQPRTRPDFSGFFFAFTEGEIHAAEALGDRHRVMLVNRRTGATMLTSVPELLTRARSTNWQVSIQL